MELTVTEVKQVIQTLPSEEREELREWLNGEEESKYKKQNRLQIDFERQKKTDRWLKKNHEKYMNEQSLREITLYEYSFIIGIGLRKKAKINKPN